MTEKRFVYYEHKGADYILDTPNESLDFIEMLGDCLEAEEIVDLLNEQHELIQQGFEEIAKANDEKFDYKMKVKKTLQKRYNHLQKIQQETEKPPRYWQGAIMEIEVIADCLGVDLND